MLKKITFMNKYRFYHPLEMMDRILSNDLGLVDPVDYRVSEKENVMEAEFKVPGFTQAEISLEVTDNVLLVEAKSDTNKWSDGFSKKYKLPETVDGSKMEAKLENGILYLRIPKKKQAVSKKISVL